MNLKCIQIKALITNCCAYCFIDEHCVSRCNSQSCILAQEEEQYLHSGDQQLTRHVLLCLLLIIGLFAVNVSFDFVWEPFL